MVMGYSGILSGYNGVKTIFFWKYLVRVKLQINLKAEWYTFRIDVFVLNKTLSTDESMDTHPVYSIYALYIRRVFVLFLFFLIHALIFFPSY